LDDATEDLYLKGFSDPDDECRDSVFLLTGETFGIHGETAGMTFTPVSWISQREYDPADVASSIAAQIAIIADARVAGAPLEGYWD
jgi:hypothetical protein